jgi:hypothetical protein
MQACGWAWLYLATLPLGVRLVAILWAPETILPPASILAYAPFQPVQTLANERRILT